jgi:EmrB/QacA subfamily drug resistance transporter
MTDNDADGPAAADEDTGYDLRYAWRALSVVTLVSIFTGLNQSTLNIALPAVVRHFEASSTSASWIILASSLVSTCVTLACGRLADVMGRRSMYLLGLGLFTFSNLAAGFSPTVQVLIGWQVVQAVASAMVITNSAAIVSTSFPPNMLSRGLGVYMAGFSVAQLLGPTVGGALATSLGWRWVFWFNVPIGMICLVWGAVTLRKVPSKSRLRGFDIVGNILLTLGLGGLIVALSDVASSGWDNLAVKGGLAAAAVFLPAFLWWERRARLPLVDLGMFKRRPFAMAILASLINSMARGAAVVMIALYFQAALGKSALGAGIALLPLAVTNALVAPSVPFLTNRMLPRTVSTIGAGVTTLGLVAMFVATGNRMGALALSVGLVLIGLGSGIFQPANIAAILEDTSEDEIGITNAIRITVQGVANLVGTALSLTLLATPLSADVRQALFAGTASTLGQGALDDLAVGYRLSFGVMAVLSCMAVLASLASRRTYKASLRAAPSLAK